MGILTLDNFDVKGKTVLLRVDMNCPIHPDTGKILGTKRIEEVVETINALDGAKIVVISHQGRVGRDDFVGMEEHAKQLEKFSNKKVRYVADVIGSLAQDEIKKMNDGEIILLDNLRLCAEENYEFSLEESARTIMVQRLKDLFDLFILDSFPSAHRTHPSLVGFAQVLPTCAGRLLEKEVKQLENILTVAKSPFTVVLGGSKVDDRLKAIKLLIKKERADHVLLTGVIANVFLRAQGRIKFPLNIKDEEIYDIGTKTLEHYSKTIASAGTVFMSGPAGFFEKPDFQFGTKSMLEAISESMATSIISGGHLTSALKQYNLSEKVSHISTAGGALVRYLTGQKLPMIKCLEDAADRHSKE